MPLVTNLGPGGKIVRKREDVLAEYYDDNIHTQFETPNKDPVKETPGIELAVEVEETPKTSPKQSLGKTKAESKTGR